jgi:acyl-CoA thioesterase
MSTGQAPLSREASLDEIRAFFAHDRFATEVCGVRIEEAGFGHARCSLAVEERHHNAMGAVMGGVVFTLADFCLAIVSNIGEAPSVSVNASVEYLSAARGSTLIATAQADKSGRSLGFYTIDVRDELGNHVARVIATVFRGSPATT